MVSASRPIRKPRTTGVSPAACFQQRLKPATAEPPVPSTWKVTRSSRRTLVDQELRIAPRAPFSSSRSVFALSSTSTSKRSPALSGALGLPRPGERSYARNRSQDSLDDVAPVGVHVRDEASATRLFCSSSSGAGIPPRYH